MEYVKRLDSQGKLRLILLIAALFSQLLAVPLLWESSRHPLSFWLSNASDKYLLRFEGVCAKLVTPSARFSRVETAFDIANNESSNG